ncbi:MAG: DUF4340 domain-containing protein [Burkholderiales bacterium]|nr:DUF4340 domain-containing protein [Burkholderiales bacterium]
MRRALWVNLVLAALVAALGAFVYLRPRDGGPRELVISGPVAGAARSIRIERPGAQPIVLERREETWFVTAPLAARADPVRVQRLLAVAGARASARLPATDLARFELDQPAVRLVIDGQRFDFGMVNAVSREQYVLVADAVYTVPLALAAAPPKGAAEMIDRQLLAHGETPEAIELPGFTVAREQGRWVVKPGGPDLSQDDIQRWVDEWRHAAALRVEPYGGRGSPAALVRMRFREGTALSLGVMAREPELVLVRPDEKLAYYLFKGAAQRLLSPPAAGK